MTHPGHPPAAHRRGCTFPPVVRVSWLIPLACWLGLSAIVWSATDATYSTCRNALVGALASGQCTTATMWHDLAAWSALAAIVAPAWPGSSSTASTRPARA